MSLDDKIGNKADDLRGKAKEALGSATGDEDLRDAGKADQAKAALRDAADKVGDAVADTADKVKNVFTKD